MIPLAVAGAALVASQLALAWATTGLTHATATTLRSVLPLIVGLSLPAGVALLLAPRLGQIAPTRSALVVLALVGLAMRAVWLNRPAPLEDDFYRYLWDGAVLAHGLNPFAVAPADVSSDPASWPAYRHLAVAGEAVLSRINFPDIRTIYPSLAQGAFALAYLVAPFDILGLRVLFLLAECITLWLLVALLRERGRSPLWAALYWWNPLPAFMLVGIAHVDALVPPCVLGALLMGLRGRPMPALALVGLGAGVKVWPVLLAPILLVPLMRDRRRLAIGLAVLGAALAFSLGPLAYSALQPDSGLEAYSSGASNNNAFFAWLVHALTWLTSDAESAESLVRAALGAATAAIALIVAFTGTSSAGSLGTRFLIVAASVFYLAPAQFPWYAVWFLSLATLTRTWPLLLASATLPAYYLFFPLWETGNSSIFFFGTAFLHSVPVLGWLAWDAYRRTRDERPMEHGNNA